MISEERLRELWVANNLRTGVAGPQAFARAVEREARREALEEAATLIEPKNEEDDWTAHARICAANANKIRALKGDE